MLEIFFNQVNNIGAVINLIIWINVKTTVIE